LTATHIINRPLPYQGQLQSRQVEEIDLVVIHCTELPDLDTARAYGERVLYPESGTGNSGHFYIDRDGRTEQWVAVEHIAHHVRGFNPRSIGIELVNTGRFPNWLDSQHQAMTEPYPPVQIEALLRLVKTLRPELPALRWITGHEDLDTEMIPSTDVPTTLIRRKVDPGPQFPWHDILAACELSRLPG
jgi:N-acetylmuramoyl-L-alanine amidase